MYRIGGFLALSEGKEMGVLTLPAQCSSSFLRSQSDFGWPSFASGRE